MEEWISPAAPRPPRAGAPAAPKKLTRKMRADEAFRAILADGLARAVAQVELLRAGRSVTALHDLRVTLRRLEAVLAAFDKVFEQRWFTELRARVKTISARLAPARDLDVFVEELLPGAGRAIARGGGDAAALKRAAQRAQGQAWASAQAYLAAEDFIQLLDDIAALSRSRLPMGGDDKLGAVAHRVLKRAARRVKTRGHRARGLQQGDLHRLRIGLKKLRYLAQLFAPLYRRKKVKPFLAAVKALQQELGQFNDIAHLGATIAQLRRVAPADGIGYSAGLLAGHYGAGRHKLAAKAMRRYRRFRTITPFWD